MIVGAEVGLFKFVLDRLKAVPQFGGVSPLAAPQQGGLLHICSILMLAVAKDPP